MKLLKTTFFDAYNTRFWRFLLNLLKNPFAIFDKFIKSRRRKSYFQYLQTQNFQSRPFLSCQTGFSASIYLFLTFLKTSHDIKKNPTENVQDLSRYPGNSVGSPGIGPLKMLIIWILQIMNHEMKQNSNINGNGN